MAQDAGLVRNLEEEIIKAMTAVKSAPLDFSKDFFGLVRTSGEESVHLLTGLGLGILDTRAGQPWQLYSPSNELLLSMDDKRSVSGTAEYVQFYQKFEMLMLLEHLKSANQALAGLKARIPENARKHDILGLLDSEIAAIHRLLSEKFGR